jgi:hypothetical protein
VAKSEIRAGDAFRLVLENNPEIWAAFEEARIAGLARVRKVMADLAERKLWWESELRDRSLPTPNSIEDWEHLADLVGIPRRDVEGMTFRGIFEQATAWADSYEERERIKAALRARANGQQNPEGVSLTEAVGKLTRLQGALVVWLLRRPDMAAHLRDVTNFRAPSNRTPTCGKMKTQRRFCERLRNDLDRLEMPFRMDIKGSVVRLVINR